MAESVNEIVLGALRSLKVKQAGETLTADESKDGRIALNDILEQLNLQSLAQPAKVQVTQAITSSDGSYTFGTGGDNSVRPTEIFNAYIRDGNIDYPVRIISNDDYSHISYKSVTSSYPYNLYFRNAYPLSTIELYPVPSSNSLTLYLECRAELSTYTSGSTSVDLPPAYIKYLKNQLAIDISPEYREPSPTIYNNAQTALEWIKRSNNKDKPSMINTARLASGRGGAGFQHYGN